MAAQRAIPAEEGAVTLLRDRIGRGSGGEVFKARQWPSGRLVAIKRLAPEHRGDAAHLRRLRQEAAMVGGLDHENIVRLLRLNAPDGRAERVELTMEYVDGVNLAELVAAGRLPVSAALHVVRSLLLALAHAHRAGIVHRDISPRNVLVSWDGQVKLSDFGLARPAGCAPTTNGNVRGTLPYASPEQLKGRDADCRSDLFAVGVLLYELLTGQRPWGGAPFEIIFALTVARKPLAPISDSCPWVSLELDAVVHKLLAYDAEDRYQSAEDASAEMAEAEDGRTELARVMAKLRPAKPHPVLRRAAWLAAAALAGYVTLIAGSGAQPPTETPEFKPAPSHASDEVKSVPMPSDSKPASAQKTPRPTEAKSSTRKSSTTAQPRRQRKRKATESSSAPARAPPRRHAPPDDGSFDIPQPVGGTIFAAPGETP